ncbi:hypothetical protein ACIQAL_14225 [Pseudomonas sp. NPDC088368]|uniref:hypothetical protein n=1 Tax=Pseudomonas sp. NPDC088368 TaxID=3364453 RepID=UPI0037FD17E8
MGAVKATASVVAVTVMLTAPTDAEKACANKGSKGCVTYTARKGQNPHKAIANSRSASRVGGVSEGVRGSTDVRVFMAEGFLR